MPYSDSFFKVCTNPGITLCILKYPSISIQPLHSSVSINRDTIFVFLRYNPSLLSALYTQDKGSCPTNL